MRSPDIRGFFCFSDGFRFRGRLFCYLHCTCADDSVFEPHFPGLGALVIGIPGSCGRTVVHLLWLQASPSDVNFWSIPYSRVISRLLGFLVQSFDLSISLIITSRDCQSSVDAVRFSCFEQNIYHSDHEFHQL